MQGLELARAYYETYGRAMIEESFAEVADRIAVGLVGEGSECFGYDDALSRDHDFEPGFCLWLSREDEASFGFALEKAYRRLPNIFDGVNRLKLAPVGGSRHGVLTIDAFYTRFLGTPYAPNSEEQWLYISPHSLACACNGELFRDDLGTFSAVRSVLKKGYPEDVRLKKLAAHAGFMAQAGQYNYGRCIERGQSGAAQLAVFVFVTHAISSVYLLNNRYEPFYKWVYRGMEDLPCLCELKDSLIGLTEMGNTDAEASAKLESMEAIADVLATEYRRQGISDRQGHDLSLHAQCITDGIKSRALRQLSLLDGV